MTSCQIVVTSAKEACDFVSATRDFDGNLRRATQALPGVLMLSFPCFVARDMHHTHTLESHRCAPRDRLRPARPARVGRSRTSMMNGNLSLRVWSCSDSCSSAGVVFAFTCAAHGASPASREPARWRSASLHVQAASTRLLGPDARPVFPLLHSWIGHEPRNLT